MENHMRALINSRFEAKTPNNNWSHMMTICKLIPTSILGFSELVGLYRNRNTLGI